MIGPDPDDDGESAAVLSHPSIRVFFSLSAMSRRASVFARQNPGKRRVRFPDEVIFENEIKEQDGDAVMNMLRRASIDIDIDRINSAGRKKSGSQNIQENDQI